MRHFTFLSPMVFVFSLFCGAGGACGDASNDAAAITGTWVVTSEFCDHCGVSPNADNGNKVIIAADAYNDPYHLSCPAGAKYVLQDITSADAQHALGVPRDVYPLAATPLTLARLECPAQIGNGAAVPLQSAKMILLAPGKAIYLWEGGTNFIMQRISK